MRNLICMTWGFSLPFFSSWKSQVASIIYTSLRLFLSPPLSAPSLFLLPPSPLLSPGNLASAALLISILQNVQMPPKIIHLPALWCHFTCTQTTPSTFCAASQTKRDGVGGGGGGLLSLTARRPLVGCFLTSSSPQLHHQSLQPKVSDSVMATDGSFSPQSRFEMNA